MGFFEELMTAKHPQVAELALGEAILVYFGDAKTGESAGPILDAAAADDCIDEIPLLEVLHEAVDGMVDRNGIRDLFERSDHSMIDIALGSKLVLLAIVRYASAIDDTPHSASTT